MTVALSDVVPSILQAIREVDPKLAQARLDAVGDSLHGQRRALLQARIYFVAGKPESAISILEDLPDRTPALLRLLARAYLQCGEAANAWVVTDPNSEKAAASLTSQNDALLRLVAATALGDKSKVVDVVTQTLAIHHDNPTLRRKSALSLITVDAIDEAGELIADLKREDNISDAALIAFIRQGLRCGRPAAIIACLPAIARLSNYRIDVLVDRAWRSIDADKDRLKLLASLGDLIVGAGSPLILNRMCITLRAEDQIQCAIDLAVRFRSEPASENSVNQAEIEETKNANAAPGVPNGDRFMEWLGLPIHRRRSWERAVWRGAAAREELRARLTSNPDAWREFVDTLDWANLEPLRAMANAGEAGILATTHAGVLTGTLGHLRTWKIPVSIIGGDPVLAELLDERERLRPITKDETASQTARRLFKIIKDNRIVGLASDGRQGSELQRAVHCGAQFTLPDSIPQLAHRYNLPIIWLATYWRDGKIVCDCETAPCVAPGESFQAFRGRWFEFVLDSIQVICRADAGNVYPVIPILQDSG